MDPINEEFPGINKKLDRETSKRASLFIQYLWECTDTSLMDIMRTVDPKAGVASLHRSFRNITRWKEIEALFILHWYGGFLDYPSTKDDNIWTHFRDGRFNPFLEFLEQNRTKVWYPRESNAKEFADFLNRQERNTRVLTAIHHELPICLMPDQMRRRYLRAFNSDRTVARALSKLAIIRKLRRTDTPDQFAKMQMHFILQSDLQRMLHREFPFNLCHPDDVQLCLDDLGAMILKNSNFLLGVVDDSRVPSDVAYIKQYDFIMSYDNDSFLILRGRNNLPWMCASKLNADVTNTFIETSWMSTLQNNLCHKFDKESIVDYLLKQNVEH